jgi:hypothetical protein
MVKFGPHDLEYRRKVEPALVEMVSNTFIQRSQSLLQIPQAAAAEGLLRAPRQNLQSGPRRSIVNIPEIGDTEERNFRSDTASNVPQQAALSSLYGVSISDACAWLTSILQELSSTVVQDQVGEIKNALNGTCDWIQKKDLYKQWLSSRKNTVLFIQAGAGFGKSVLAKYLIGAIGRSSTDPRRMVTYYFPKPGAHSSTPRTILIHILSQIHQKDPTSFENAALSLYQRFMHLQRDLSFYWNLFNAVRLSQQSDLICIIDGLDECIKASKPRGQTTVNYEMVSFLRRVCDLSEEVSVSRTQAFTKILFTTRSEPEFEVATAQVANIV